VVAVSDNQWHVLGHVAADQEHGRQLFTLADTAQIVLDVHFLAGQKRQVAGAQQVFRDVLDGLRPRESP
jgi:hypothetical protein